MVSKRFKAYENIEPSGDSLANDTSASTFSLDLKIYESARITKRKIDVDNQSFSRKDIEELAISSSVQKISIPSIISYKGEKPELVEAHEKQYVALKKLKSKGGFMRFIVYDLQYNKVKLARTRFERRVIEQESKDTQEDSYDDLIAKLEEEYQNRG